jgi:hypothetical protein
MHGSLEVAVKVSGRTRETKCCRPCVDVNVILRHDRTPPRRPLRQLTSRLLTRSGRLRWRECLGRPTTPAPLKLDATGVTLLLCSRHRSWSSHAGRGRRPGSRARPPARPPRRRPPAPALPRATVHGLSRRRQRSSRRRTRRGLRSASGWARLATFRSVVFGKEQSQHFGDGFACSGGLRRSTLRVRSWSAHAPRKEPCCACLEACCVAALPVTRFRARGRAGEAQRHGDGGVWPAEPPQHLLHVRGLQVSANAATASPQGMSSVRAMACTLEGWPSPLHPAR